MPEIGLVGGGVIGGGWAARFLLNGHDVRLFDPDPDAPRKVGEVLDNARRAFARLTLAPLPAEGRLSFAATVAEAVEGTSFVQESAPEREDVKRVLLALLAFGQECSVVFRPDALFQLAPPAFLDSAYVPRFHGLSSQTPDVPGQFIREVGPLARNAQEAIAQHLGPCSLGGPSESLSAIATCGNQVV